MPTMSLFPPPEKQYTRLPTISSSSSLSSLALNPTSKTPSLLHPLLRKRIRVGKFHIPLLFLLLLPPVLIVVYFAFLRHGPNQSSVLSSLPPMRGIATTVDEPFVYGCQDPRKAAEAHPRVNGAFVMLARNSELQGVLYSIDSIERHFNRWFNYPYVFLNDQHFNSTFKAAVINATSSPVQFGKVDKSMFGFPDWVDQSWAKEGIASQGDRAIMYGGLESYHHMCRFYSGFFYKHDLLKPYDWYWRIEPDVTYFCDITYDPFLYMEQHNKTYGFVIAIKELVETVPNLFRYASAYKRANNFKSKGLWEMFLKDQPDPNEPTPMETPGAQVEHRHAPPESDAPPEVDPEGMEGESYNMCHFWSNFEIARLDFFRSKEYEDFFTMMDHSGGFWQERWGDAPIHSLAAGILLSPSQVHYFRDIGYQHTDIQHCPANAPKKQLPRPAYENEDHDQKKATWDSPRQGGVGCRCTCPTDLPEVEDKDGSCLADWVRVVGGYTSDKDGGARHRLLRRQLLGS